MEVFATDYARRLNEQGIPFGATRIGVHAGEVIVGNFGGKTMFDYRALGDPVNTAARLESANKHLGTYVCISETILAEVPGAEVRPVGKVVFKGKTHALAVFETLGPSSATGRAPLDRYLAAYRALVADPAAAPRLFAELHAEHPDDRLVAMQHRRLQDGQNGELIVLAEK
jgi:adenylate cyclase